MHYNSVEAREPVRGSHASAFEIRRALGETVCVIEFGSQRSQL
jgi:hypothetical protein